MSADSLGVLFILGIGVFGGMMGAWLFQRLRIPQVVGYIAIGLLIGQSGLRIVTAEDVEALGPFNLFALGIIGFLVGGEVQITTLRKYARQFTAILLGEGLAASLLVGAGSYLVLWLVLDDWTAALAGAVVLGAIASATDPASTISVLWEYRARGVLTTSIIAIVALDDALAMVLYGLGTSIAEILTVGDTAITSHLLRILLELGAAIAMGAVGAVLLNVFLRWMHKPDRSMSLALGFLLLVISIAAFTHLDVILATMTLGFVLTNLAPRRSKELFEVLRSFSLPIYVLFFVLVGARLGIADMPGWLWGIVVVYVVGRSVGKIGGAWLGARATQSDPVVQKYLGVGLFAQGGVAVGLAIMAGHHLRGIVLSNGMVLGDMIVFAVTATTLILQVIGPPLVKWAVKASGEAGRDVTEEDIIAGWTVQDVMNTPIHVFSEKDSLRTVVHEFSQHDQLIYPVVDTERRLTGTLGIDELKSVLANRDAWDWLLATDLMAEAAETAAKTAPLQPTLDRMHDTLTEEMVVVGSTEDAHPVGLVDHREVRRRVAAGLLAHRDVPGSA